jgi:hypothetical protein
MWESAARMYLEAHYGGKWRMLFALTKYTLKRSWLHRGWPTWERFRVNILRRPQNEALAQYERVSAEMDAVEELAREL